MPCVEVAEKMQVQLLIEPEPGLLIERFGQYLEFVERIDSPWVGLNFDIGHAYCVGEDPQDWVARMATHTRHYHFEDIAATRVHKHLIPGTGRSTLPPRSRPSRRPATTAGSPWNCILISTIRTPRPARPRRF